MILVEHCGKSVLGFRQISLILAEDCKVLWKEWRMFSANFEESYLRLSAISAGQKNTQLLS